MIKFVLVGAGSAQFGCDMLGDIFSTKSLEGSHITLLDINPNALKKVYDDYTREKVRIQSSNQFKTRLFQSLPFALPGIIGLIISVTGDSNQGWVIGSLLLTVLAPVGGIYLGARQSAKIPQQLQDLTNQFKIDYVCPKCGTFLGDIPWESLRNKKHCPVSSCQAKWVEE